MNKIFKYKLIREFYDNNNKIITCNVIYKKYGYGDEKFLQNKYNYLNRTTEYKKNSKFYQMKIDEYRALFPRLLSFYDETYLIHKIKDIESFEVINDLENKDFFSSLTLTELFNNMNVNSGLLLLQDILKKE